RVWDGGGADVNWTNPLNWVGDGAPNPGDDLLFPGGVPADRLNTTNNFAAGTAFGSLTFAAAGYTVGGNALTLVGGVAATNPTGTNTVGVALTLGAALAATSTYAGATLSLTGPVNTNGHTLTVSGSGATNLTGAVTGSGGITKDGPGTLSVSGN